MDFPLPEIGEGVYEAELVRWLVKVGDTVKRGQNLLEVMTDKATMDVPAAFAGTITRLDGAAGEKIKVGEPILGYEPAGVREPAVVGKETQASRPEAKRQGSARMLNGPPPAPASRTPVAAPSVRHLARTLGIDLGRIAGTGPAGRILLDDLTPFLGKPPAAEPKTVVPQLDFGNAGTRIKFQGMRRRIAEHLVDAKKRIPHYSYVDECDVTELVKLRASLREPCSQRGLKLTYLAFFVKAVAQALKEVPIVNASLDEQGGEIVLHDKYHVGIAVAAPGGLIVPVIHDADKKDLFALAADIDRLSAEAKAGRSRLDDLRGGTFTVTSIGNIGGLISTPIINHPEVGIMGVGKVAKRPVYDAAGDIRPAELVYLSFSFDHRVVDGAIGASFGNAVMRYLQNPAALLLPEKLKP